MKLVDEMAPDATLRLRSLLASAAEHKAEAEKLERRISAIKEEIAAISDVCRVLEARKVALPPPPADAAARILAGEVVSDGADERSKKLHHNAVVDQEITRQRGGIAALISEQERCAAAIERATKAQEDVNRRFFSLLLSASYDAAQKAVDALISDFLGPLYTLRSECQARGVASDHRIMSTFDQTALYEICGGSLGVRRIWPPHITGLSSPGSVSDIISAIAPTTPTKSDR
jgi:hypothetical protein